MSKYYQKAKVDLKKACNFCNDTYIQNNLYTSAAWMELSGAACQIYIIFLGKRRGLTKIKDPKGKEKPSWEAKNQNNLDFSCWDALNVFGLTIPRFRRGIKELFKYGFLTIVKHGLPQWREKTIYSLSENWKNFGTDKFIEYAPPDFEKFQIGGKE